MTSKVYKKKRPPNFSYVLIEAQVHLQRIYSVSSGTDVFTHQASLALPKSNRMIPPAPTTTGTLPRTAGASASGITTTTGSTGTTTGTSSSTEINIIGTLWNDMQRIVIKMGGCLCIRCRNDNATLRFIIIMLQ